MGLQAACAKVCFSWMVQLLLVASVPPRVSADLNPPSRVPAQIEAGTVAVATRTVRWPQNEAICPDPCPLTAKVMSPQSEVMWLDLAAVELQRSVNLVSGRCFKGDCRPTLHFKLPLRASVAAAGTRTVRGTLTLKLGEKTLARYPIVRTVRVSAAKPDVGQLDALVKGYERWFYQAKRSTNFGAKNLARTEMEAAKARVRAMALLEGGDQAVIGLSKIDTLQVEQTEIPLPTGTVQDGIKDARLLLKNLRFAKAERLLRAIYRSKVARPKELAQVLLLLGSVELISGRRNAGGRSAGQALCLWPSQPIPDLHRTMVDALQKSRESSPCETETELSITSVSTGPSEDSIEVTLRAAPDPFQLIRRVRVSWLQKGQAKHAVSEVAGEKAVAQIVASFPPASDEVLLRAEAFDSLGNRVSVLGDPEPDRRVVSGLVNDEGFSVPEWVWWTGGAVVLTAAAVAGGVWLATQEDDPSRGIGPISVEF